MIINFELILREKVVLVLEASKLLYLLIDWLYIKGDYHG